MAKKKKRLSDTELAISNTIYGDNWFEDNSKWFKELVDSKKEKVDKKELDSVRRMAQKKNSKKQPFYTLGDICKVLDLQFPRDKEDRNRIAKFSNLLQTQQNTEAPLMLWNGLVAAITRDDIIHPTDIFLSKAESRKARKRRKTEKKVGERKVNVPKSDDAKAAARKERARIRKEAAKLGISTEEYKERQKSEVA